MAQGMQFHLESASRVRKRNILRPAKLLRGSAATRCEVLPLRTLLAQNLLCHCSLALSDTITLMSSCPFIRTINEGYYIEGFVLMLQSVTQAGESYRARSYWCCTVLPSFGDTYSLHLQDGSH
jgi:hypothetical protein